MLEIRGKSLEIISFLSQFRTDVLKLLVEFGISDICLNYIKIFPDDLVNN